jgi:hypothetical protein
MSAEQLARMVFYNNSVANAYEPAIKDNELISLYTGYIESYAREVAEKFGIWLFSVWDNNNTNGIAMSKEKEMEHLFAKFKDQKQKEVC